MERGIIRARVGEEKLTEKKVVQSLFINRFIDKQTIKKNKVNWCTNCLIVSHLFSLVYTTIFELITK